MEFFRKFFNFNTLMQLGYKSKLFLVTKVNLVGDRWIELDSNLINDLDPSKFNTMLNGIGRSGLQIDLARNNISVLKNGTIRDLDSVSIYLNENTLNAIASRAIQNFTGDSILYLQLAADGNFAADMFQVLARVMLFNL